MLIGAEHVVLLQRERPVGELAKLLEPPEERVAAAHLAGQRAGPGHVPHDALIDQLGEDLKVTRAERIRGPAVCRGVRMLPHAANGYRSTDRYRPNRDPCGSESIANETSPMSIGGITVVPPSEPDRSRYRCRSSTRA